MPSDTVDRRSSIIEILNKRGKIYVDDLSKAFHVSDVTVRNDLKILEQEGFLRRIHGGALKSEPVAFDQNLDEKQRKHTAEKRKIGVYAARLVHSGETIFVDSGTTTGEMAKNIKGVCDVTVITNALNIAAELATHDGVEVVVTGGVLRKRSCSFVGPHAEHTVSEYFGDKLFLGVDGISLQYGVTTPNSLEAQVNRMMVERVNEVIVVADSSKFNRHSRSLIITLDRIHKLITDPGVSEQDAAALRSMNIEVVVV